MSLVARLRQLAQAQGPRGRPDLHKRLLQEFVEHGEAAKPEEGVALLQLLRGHFDGRFDFRAEGPGKSRFVRGQEASAWAGECLQHDGFAVLRRQVLAAERLRELDNAGLSAVYMQLRKMRLEEAAGEVWPAVESRILSGELRETRPLVDIWRVAPEEHIPLMDGLLSRAIPASPADRQKRPLLITLSRAADAPESQAVVVAAKGLAQLLPSLSDTELESVVRQIALLDKRQGRVHAQLRQLCRQAVEEFRQRDSMLPSSALNRLLFSGVTIRGGSDDLLVWPLVRDLLLWRGEWGLLKADHCMEVFRVLHETAGRSDDPEADAELSRRCAARLGALLNNKEFSALSAVRHVVSDARMESIADKPELLKTLVWAANKLRSLGKEKDSDPGAEWTPGVEWALFRRFCHLDLLTRHPGLQPGLKHLGEVTIDPRHGRLKRIPLAEMLSLAEFMNAHDIVLRSLLLHTARRLASELEAGGGGSASASQVQEGGAEESAEAEVAGEVSAEAEEASGAQGPPAWEHAVGFREQLRRIGLEEPRLDKALVAALGAPGAFSELGVDPARVARMLAGVSRDGTSDALRRAVVAEVGRRTGGEGAPMELPELVALQSAWAPWSSEPSGEDGEPLVRPELALRVAELIAASLAKSLTVESLTVAAGAFAALGSEPAADTLASLRQSLHRLSGPSGAPRCQPAVAAELAYEFAALHGGPMPMDVAIRLWRQVVGGSVAGRRAAASPVLSSAAVAKLGAFDLAARHLSTTSVAAALRLAPETAAVEALLQRHAVFELAQEPEALALEASLRASLPEALPGEPCTENFEVPGTPFVVSFALEGHRLLLVVPRQGAHRAGRRLSGHARLMESVLKALGWRLRWVWPEEWSERLAGAGAGEGEGGEAKLEAIRDLLGPDVAPSLQAVRATLAE